MFRANTVLVLGAGASVEVGLPVGADLLHKITELTHITYEHFRMKSGDHKISEAIKILVNEGREVDKYNQHLEAAWQLGRSAKQALSIDNVIDALEDQKVELVGKLGIIRAILSAEGSSPAFRKTDRFPNEINLENFSNTWYSYFSKILTENLKKSEIDNIFNNLSIINFNYDRCLEYYLPHSIGNYYGLNPDNVHHLVNGLKIYRPYGVTGKLPWQAGDTPTVPFGSGSSEQISSLASHIKTFTERLDEEKTLNDIRECISSADRIIFLGFAFHRQNVALISSYVKRNVEILATSFGISKSDKNVIENELSRSFCYEDGEELDSNHIDLADVTCRDLFRDYWRTLTAEAGDEYVDPVSYLRG